MFKPIPLWQMSVLVVSVTDGDTVKVVEKDKDESPAFKVRLHGLDAPEILQVYGKESKQALSDMVLGKSVTLDVFGVDRYGRTVGVLHDGNWKRSFNKMMIEIGMAYNWNTYGMLWGGDRAERKARAKRVGVWKRFAGEIRPWSWRHGGGETPKEYVKAKLEEAEKTRARRREIEARVEAELAEQGA